MLNLQTVCPDTPWPIVDYSSMSLCSSPNTAIDFRSVFYKALQSQRDNSPVPKGMGKTHQNTIVTLHNT